MMKIDIVNFLQKIQNAKENIVFPDGAAVECRWCWDVNRAVLVKGLP